MINFDFVVLPDCKDPLLSLTWLATWQTHKRKPTFRNDNHPMDNLRARQKYGLGKQL